MTDLDALAAVPLFAGLDQVRLHRLATRSTIRIVDADCVVAIRGQPATHLIVVESGTLTATHGTADGRRLRLGQFPRHVRWTRPRCWTLVAIPPPGRLPPGHGCASYLPTICWPPLTTSLPHAATS